MRRLRNSLLFIIILGFVIAVLLTGIVCVAGFGSMERAQSTELFYEDAAEDAEILIAKLSEMQEMTERLAAIYREDLPAKEAFANKADRLAYVAEAEQEARLLLYESDDIAAVYYRINPSISDETTGYFLLQSGEELISTEPTDLTAYEMYDRSHVAWWYETIANRTGSWLEPYENENDGIYTLSYTIPLYDDNNFLIGVVGIDYDFAEILDDVAALSSEEGIRYTLMSADGTIYGGVEIPIEEEAIDDILSSREEVVYSIDETDGVILYAQKLETGDYFLGYNELTTLYASQTRTVYSIIMLSVLIATILVVILSGIIMRAFHGVESDSLTGAYNRNAYNDFVTEVDEHFVLYRSFQFAVAVFDVNGLKMVNDSFGHKEGDLTIQRAYQYLQKTFSGLRIYRIGGDEFVIIAKGYRRVLLQQKMKDVYSEMERRKREQQSTGNREIVISAGVAEYSPSQDHCYDDVFERADRIMYEEKAMYYKMFPELKR